MVGQEMKMLRPREPWRLLSLSLSSIRNGGEGVHVRRVFGNTRCGICESRIRIRKNRRFACLLSVIALEISEAAVVNDAAVNGVGCAAGASSVGFWVKKPAMLRR